MESGLQIMVMCDEAARSTHVLVGGALANRTGCLLFLACLEQEHVRLGVACSS